MLLDGFPQGSFFKRLLKRGKQIYVTNVEVIWKHHGYHFELTSDIIFELIFWASLGYHLWADLRHHFFWADFLSLPWTSFLSLLYWARSVLQWPLGLASCPRQTDWSQTWTPPTSQLSPRPGGQRRFNNVDGGDVDCVVGGDVDWYDSGDVDSYDGGDVDKGCN